MTADLDRLLTALRERPLDDRLDHVEPGVWKRIEDETFAVPVRSGWRWQAGLAALMLTFGVYAGGAAAGRPVEASPFEVRAAFAPSTLLEGGN